MNSFRNNPNTMQAISMQVILEFAGGPAAPSHSKITVRPGETVQVGRLANCDLQVADPSISGKHFSIEFTDDGVQLKDLGSRNGTWVNGEKEMTASLNNDDEIRAGKTNFKIGFVHSNANISESSFYGSNEREPSGSRENVFEFGNSIEVKTDTDDLPSSTGQRQPIETSFEPESKTEVPATAVPIDDSSLPTSVLLKTTFGSGEEDEIRIRNGQALVFGSSSRADITFPSAKRARHFSIECRHDECWLKCFSKRDPVVINGQSIFESRIYDGDTLISGSSTFEISLTGRGKDATSSEPHAEPKTKELTPAKHPVNTGLPRVTGSRFTSEFTGSIRVEGENSELPVEKLLRLFHSSLNAFLLVDFFRLGLAAGAYKQHKLSTNESGMVGSYLVPVNDEKKLLKWSDEISGSDCGLFIFSKTQPDELKKQLSEIRTNDHLFCDVCWPSVFRIALSSGCPDAVKQFLSVANFSIVETESPAKWSIICNEKNSNQLEKLGIEIESLEKKHA